MRHLAYIYPDMGYESIKNQFLLGDDILVTPVIEKNTYSRLVIFPPGIWKGEDGSIFEGPVRVPIKVPVDILPWFRRMNSGIR